jgi:hypothetical protein
MTCIVVEWVTTLATAVRSTSRSSSSGISSNLRNRNIRFAIRAICERSKSTVDDAPFDPRDHVAVHETALENPEPMGALGLNDAPSVRQHLDAADLEHRPKLVEEAGVTLGGDDHSEARGADLQTSA